jgi:hypothetical protein
VPQRNTAPLWILLLLAVGVSLRQPGQPGAPAGPLAAGSVARAAKRPTTAGEYLGKPGARPFAEGKVEFLIVTVPDPAASHFAYIFDSLTESIQRAAAESNYLFDRYWLPWKPSQQEDALASIAGPQPGVLLFRKQDASGTLVVFLAGESPTFGLNKDAFQRALDVIQEVNGGKPPDSVRVAGPTFSGSIPSLRQAIVTARSQWQAAKDPSARKDVPFRVISGSATNEDNAEQMQADGVEYSAVIENDSFSRNQFLAYLNERLGIPPNRVAILSESGTAFGSGFAAGKQGGPLALPFPMEIARLRNAYQEDPDLKSLWSGRKDAPQARTGLELSLKDTGTPSDRVPSFSTAQTALAQQITLANIASMIRREDIQAAGVVATDIPDAVFVTKLIQQDCPDVRMFTLDADILYQHSSGSLSFSGMLLVTTYPLFAQNQFWQQSKQGGRRLLQFPNQAAQGLYNACRMLLEPGDAARRNLLEYSDPVRADARKPPLWVMAVGQDGFWPVRLLADCSEANRSSLAESEAPARDPSRPMLPNPPHLWYIGFWFFTSLYIWHIVHVACLLRSRQTGAALPVYIEIPDSRGPECAGYLIGAEVTMLAAYLPLVAVHVHYLQMAAGEATRFAKLTAWAGLAVSAGLVVCLLGWTLDLSKSRKALAWSLFAVMAAALGFYGWTWRQIHDPADLEDANNLFFSLRSLFPASGLSPVLPAVFLVSAITFWLLVNVQRLRWKEVRAPRLPELDAADPRLIGFDACARKTHDCIDRFLFQPWIAAGVAGAFLVSVWLFDFHSLESRLYDAVFGGALRVVLFLTMFTALRFLFTWLRLQDALRRLEWHPLRGAFERLGKSTPEVSYHNIWLRGGKKRNLAPLVHSVQRLRSLPERVNPADLGPIDEKLKSILECDARGRRESAQAFEEAYEGLARIANQLLTGLLSAHWRGPAESPPAAVSVVATAEEFVALRLSAFLRYVTSQLRNLLDCLTSGFLLVLLAILSYPFQPRRTLLVIGTILFFVVGAAILTVFYQMDRNTILSLLSGTDPGTTSRNFIRPMISYGALPLLTLLVTQFPELRQFVLAFVEPLLRAVQ